MRAYSAANEEALRTRDLLKDWAAEGFLTDVQYQRMEQETVCDFRGTNIFLRIVLFFFTLIIVAAGAGLFFAVFTPRSAEQTNGVLLLIFAGTCYLAAETAVSQARLYRYGIEEALAVYSVGFLCVGVTMVFFGSLDRSGSQNGSQALIPAVGAMACLWIWRRFGLPYFFFLAMIFVIWLPLYWTSSQWAQHAIVAALYAAGLGVIMAVRSRHGQTYLDLHYSIAEAMLWLGIYLAINLQISPVNLLGYWGGASRATGDFSRLFYWATWALTWFLPPVVLTIGLQKKDRLVIAVGAIVAVLTLGTNKLYLGWERHSWDPMLLGVLLMGVAIVLRRWLASGPEGVRYGFTAQRLSAKDKRWLNAGAAVLGVVVPQPIPVGQQPDHQAFSGGDSGGGGASSDF